MTIQVDDFSQTYAGSGSALSCPFPLAFWDEDELVVLKVAADGTETTLVLDTDFTISGGVTENGVTTYPSGCTIAYPKAGSGIANLPAGESLYAYIEVGYTQPTDLVNSGFDRNLIEKELDRGCRRDMQLLRFLDLALRFRVSLGSFDNILPDPVANAALLFNAAGTGFTTGAVDISNFTAASKEEIQTATDNQTVFSLGTFTYMVGGKSLSVFAQGLLQIRGTDYTETDSGTVTFAVGRAAGDRIVFKKTDVQSLVDVETAKTAAEVAQVAAEVAQVAAEVAQVAAEAAAVEAASAVGYKTVPTEQTISSGAITISSTSSWTRYTLDGEGDAADILDTINGGTQGQRVTFQLENTARPITIEPSATIKMAANFTMNNLADRWEVEYDSSLLAWVEINRANNG